MLQNNCFIVMQIQFRNLPVNFYSPLPTRKIGRVNYESCVYYIPVFSNEDFKILIEYIEIFLFFMLSLSLFTLSEILCCASYFLSFFVEIFNGL